MNVWQRLRCASGRHERDRHKAEFDGEVFRSVCTGCGTPMRRDVAGWNVVPEHAR